MPMELTFSKMSRIQREGFWRNPVRSQAAVKSLAIVRRQANVFIRKDWGVSPKESASLADRINSK